jgi:hypothetical protein
MVETDGDGRISERSGGRRLFVSMPWRCSNGQLATERGGGRLGLTGPVAPFYKGEDGAPHAKDGGGGHGRDCLADGPGWTCSWAGAGWWLGWAEVGRASGLGPKGEDKIFFQNFLKCENNSMKFSKNVLKQEKYSENSQNSSKIPRDTLGHKHSK